MINSKPTPQRRKIAELLTVAMSANRQEEIVAEREKKNEAFRVAAHAAIWRLFGGTGHCELWRNTESNVKAGERAWQARFVVTGKPRISKETVPLLGCAPTSNSRKRLFRLAGLVAEYIADGEDDSWGIHDLIEGNRTLNDGSEDWSIGEVDEVTPMLLALWPTIEQEVGQLFETVNRDPVSN